MTLAHPAIDWPHDRIAPSIARVQNMLLWFIGFGGAIVFIEPSPYEIGTLLAMAFFIASGLRFNPTFIPLAALLFALNLGYSICAAYLMNDSQIVFWILTSWYMGVTALFFAMVFSENTAERFHALARGLIIGAVVASLLGIGGYFHLLPGYDTLTLYGRVRGTFKDPNVLSAYLILPSVLSMQGVLLYNGWRRLRNLIALGIITLAILLAFSRAAWGLYAGTMAITFALMFVISRSPRERVQMIGVAIIAMVMAILLIAVLLSMDSVANLFKERASFGQSYDSGRFGRFGRHLLGAQMALDLPFGIGPLQFNKFFPEDTHNSYLNAFMSGGWISGIVYPSLIFSSLVMGIRYLLTRTPWHGFYIAVFVVFAGTVVESFIIDTDHWRHFFLMLGSLWGMIVATHLYRRARARAPQEPSITTH